jgi:phage-related protein
VKVVNTDGVPIIAAIRDAWAVNGVTTSFSQLMGLPLSQVSDKYVFPAYNNVTLNEQLRIGNVDTVESTVTVTIGGVLRGTYTLQPSEAVRINYAGLDSGPVIVQGTAGVDIIAAIREAWAVNGVTKSFVQLMGLPATQLSNKYVFPAYNNVTLNEQLRIGNVDTVESVVTVTIGGVLRGTYTLQPNQAVRVNYTGLDSGPVVVEGTVGVDIIAAIRDAWAVNGVTTSFSQLMGMPAGQLSDQYLFPAYNNVTLNEQLRIGNVDTIPTTVTVTIGGVLRGTYPLEPNEAVRINYAGLDSGPVVVQGTAGVDIISAIRDAWAVNGVTQSFVQLMGLPAGHLSATYLFPAYNNVTLNEQLRIGMP